MMPELWIVRGIQCRIQNAECRRVGLLPSLNGLHSEFCILNFRASQSADRLDAIQPMVEAKAIAAKTMEMKSDFAWNG